MKKLFLFMNVCMIMGITLSAQQYTGSSALGTSDRNDASVRPQKAIHQDAVVQEELHYKEVYSYNIQQKQELLENKHKMFFGLPYPHDYISNTIMPSIRNERNIVAPNFPVRTSSRDTDRENMKNWFENHTEEYIQYLIFLDDRYLSLKNAVNNPK